MSGKENIDRVSFRDGLQNNSMLPFHATNKNWLVPTMLAAGANRKIAPVIFFVNIICATATVLLFHQLFYFFTLSLPPALFITSKG